MAKLVSKQYGTQLSLYIGNFLLYSSQFLANKVEFMVEGVKRLINVETYKYFK